MNNFTKLFVGYIVLFITYLTPVLFMLEVIADDKITDNIYISSFNAVWL